MEVIGEFIYKHRVFLICLLVSISCYYALVFFYLKRKKKKSTNNNNFSVLNLKDKNISILASELDDVPVIDDNVSTSGDKPSDGADWKKYLNEINEQSDRIRQNEIIDDLLDETGIDTED
ncbi:MAG: hypothetical protein AAGH46_12740 [Bacteroidota bacterium]